MSTWPDVASCTITDTRPPPFAKSSVERSSDGALGIARLLTTVSGRPRYAQPGAELGRERAVRRHSAVAERRHATVPVAELAARLPHHGDKRRGVPRRHEIVDHQ